MLCMYVCIYSLLKKKIKSEWSLLKDKTKGEGWVRMGSQVTYGAQENKFQIQGGDCRRNIGHYIVGVWEQQLSHINPFVR